MASKKKIEYEGGESPGGGKKRPPKLGNPDADPVRIHREYVEQRLSGGADATPEAYTRALRQWHELPGALSTPPSEVGGDEGAPTSTESHEEPDARPDREQPA